VGREVEVAEILPGDLIFFVPDKGQAGYVSHTGIVTEVNGAEYPLYSCVVVAGRSRRQSVCRLFQRPLCESTTSLLNFYLFVILTQDDRK
jgi:hypothetical protein